MKDDDEPDDLTMETGLDCACCTQEVEASEEAVFLQIVQAQSINEKIEYYPVLKDSDGDYQFSPLFVHLDGCWEDVQEGIHEKIEDTPPVEDAYSLLPCTSCGSGIREWEYFALGQHGEFHCSPHTPGHAPVYAFVPWGGKDEKRIHTCLACIAKISEDTLDDWDDVSQIGECAFCTHARCWRDPSCSCFCHMEPPHEE